MKGIGMPTVEYEVREGVAEILLNHGPVNSVDRVVIDELLAALQRAREDRTVRAVIVGSAIPRRFCAGLNLDAFRNGESEGKRDLIDKIYVQLCDAQHCLGKPSIAAVGGA